MQRIGRESDVAKLTSHGWKQSYGEQAAAAWQGFVAKIATASRRSSAN